MKRIRIFSLEEMLEKGCFISSNNKDEQSIVYYDGEEKVKNASDLEKALETDPNYIDFIWTCFFADEVECLPIHAIELENAELEDHEEWFYISSRIGTIPVPNLEGIIYEVLDSTEDKIDKIKEKKENMLKAADKDIDAAYDLLRYLFNSVLTNEQIENL